MRNGTIPKVGEDGILGWFRSMTRAYGDHPRFLATCERVLADAGIRRSELTEQLLRQATRDCWPIMEEWVAAINATNGDNPHKIAYATSRIDEWHNYGVPVDSGAYNTNGQTQSPRPTGDSEMATATAKKPSKTKVVKVSREDVVALLHEMGVSEQLVNDKTKPKALNEMVREVADPLSRNRDDKVTTAKLKDLLDLILSETEKGNVVEVTDVVNVETNGTVPPPQKKGKGKAKPSPAVESEGGKPVKKKGGKKSVGGEGHKPGARKGEVFGYSVTAVIRYMGENGFSREEVVKALDHYGVRECLSPSTVSTCLQYGRERAKGDHEKFPRNPAPLNRQQATELKKVSEYKNK